MTPKQAIKRTLELDAAATAGPWERRHGHDVLDYTPDSVDFAGGGGAEVHVAGGWEGRGPQQCRDAELIAAYRTLAPFLAKRLALAEAVVQRLAETNPYIDGLCNYCGLIPDGHTSTCLYLAARALVERP